MTTGWECPILTADVNSQGPPLKNYSLIFKFPAFLCAVLLLLGAETSSRANLAINTLGRQRHHRPGLRNYPVTNPRVAADRFRRHAQPIGWPGSTAVQRD